MFSGPIWGAYATTSQLFLIPSSVMENRTEQSSGRLRGPNMVPGNPDIGGVVRGRLYQQSTLVLWTCFGRLVMDVWLVGLRRVNYWWSILNLRWSNQPSDLGSALVTQTMRLGEITPSTTQIYLFPICPDKHPADVRRKSVPPHRIIVIYLLSKEYLG